MPIEDPTRLFFDCFALAALASLAILGIGRAVALGRRGISVVPIDRTRRPPEIAADLVFVLAFVLWAYAVFAFSLGLRFHLAPAVLVVPVVHSTLLHVLGTATMTTGLVIYALALRTFGTSWRLTIDRDHAGTLVTSGIFARTRNPIYLALGLLAAGSFLVLGRPLLLVLAILFAAYFRHLIHREEAFLRDHYGEPYLQYCRRVGRLWTFRLRG